MRLLSILLRNPLGDTPSTCALAALTFLNAARLPARLDLFGNLTALADQDRSQFDQALAQEGVRLLDRSATGPDLTDYHVEAAIAWIHTTTQRTEDTDWATIVSLYDQLMAIRPSPIVALNRAIAIGQSEGPQRGLAEIHAMQDAERLASYPFTMPPSANWSCAVRRRKPPASTSPPPPNWRAIPWNEVSSSTGLASAPDPPPSLTRPTTHQSSPLNYPDTIPRISSSVHIALSHPPLQRFSYGVFRPRPHFSSPLRPIQTPRPRASPDAPRHDVPQPAPHPQ